MEIKTINLSTFVAFVCFYLGAGCGYAAARHGTRVAIVGQEQRLVNERHIEHAIVVVDRLPEALRKAFQNENISQVATAHDVEDLVEDWFNRVGMIADKQAKDLLRKELSAELIYPSDKGTVFFEIEGGHIKPKGLFDLISNFNQRNRILAYFDHSADCESVPGFLH